MSPLAPADVTVGGALAPLTRTVTQDQITAYAAAAGDPNPIHTDPDVARAFGFPAPIAHGMLTLAILTEAVAAWAGGYDRVASISVRFSRPLIAGDTITCTGRVADVDVAAGMAGLELEALSDRGDRVLTNGRASVRLVSRD
ncbi:MAG TPA: MaoC family dehydratase [Candidatus Dormibacteraeota bacterium]